MHKTLVSLSSTNKIRVAEIRYEWDSMDNYYVIYRTTYQLGGKHTQQPEIIVDKGKATRSVTEQVNLQFNALVKKYLDKGYKEWVGELNEPDIRELLGDIKTGQDGIVKPMLAKQADKVANKFFEGDFYGSRKINGTRCLIFVKDGEIHTSSRGAINYDLALFHITHHPKLVEFFNNHPEVILDGEIYKHGMTLNTISGLVRHQSTVEETDVLEFYWYDVVDTNKPFADRLEDMEGYAYELKLLDFDPNREWNEDDLKIQFLPQIPISGWTTMMKYHDEYVREGWEGLVIRKASAVYGPGKRSNDMIKIKIYSDSEFKVVGLAEGLREEDMCFVMETENGQQFKAKPIGDRKQKQWYREHVDELVGKMATVKYFEMSGKEGSEVPQQPIFIAIRDYE